MRVTRGLSAAARGDRRAGPRGGGGHRRRRREDRHGRSARRRSRRWARRWTCCRRRARGAGPGDGGRERRAPARAGRRAGAARAPGAAGNGRHPQPRRGGGAGRHGRDAGRASWRARCTRWARARWWSPAGTARPAADLFFDGERLEEIPGERHPDGAAHGSGCTHSSALACGLARGIEPLEAARFARAIAGDAVRDGLRELGRGPGPVNALGVAPGAGARPGRLAPGLCHNRRPAGRVRRRPIPPQEQPRSSSFA